MHFVSSHYMWPQFSSVSLGLYAHASPSIQKRMRLQPTEIYPSKSNPTVDICRISRHFIFKLSVRKLIIPHPYEECL